MSLCFFSLDSSKIFNELILQELIKKGFDGLSESLITLFPYIDEYQNITASQLSKKAGYTRQAMHKNVKKLETLEYITLTQENQKEKHIKLSPKGEKLMLIANQFIEDTEKELAKFIGKEELSLYKETQMKVYKYLQSMQ